jgi:hypothetical protein
MWIKGLIRFFIESSRRPMVRIALLTAYYLAIIAVLVIMYGQGDISSTDFVYQGF